jgi:hypothetical protein
MRSYDDRRPNSTTEQDSLVGTLRRESRWQMHPNEQTTVKPDRSLGIKSPRPNGEILLDRVSTLITRPEFTKQDFGKVLGLIKGAAGSIQLGYGESLTTVPNLVPKDKTDEIAIQTGPDGVNIVYVEKNDDDGEDANTNKWKSRTVKRVVIGSDFSATATTDTTSARSFQEVHVNEAVIHNQPEPVIIPAEGRRTLFDYATHGRDVCTDIFIAYQAAKGVVAIDEALKLRDHIKAGDITAQELQNA